jgi:hypothetical protein
MIVTENGSEIASNMQASLRHRTAAITAAIDRS